MSEREGRGERGSSYRCMHKRGFDWANIITWNEIKTVNESLFHSVSPSILSFFFFIMRIPNIFNFIIVPPTLRPLPHTHPHTHTYPKCHMYENEYIYKATDMSWYLHGSHIHSVYKSHYWWQRGYLQCLSTVTITDSNQHGVKVLSLDMPLLKKCIMITWLTVPKQLECHSFTFCMAFCTNKTHRKVRRRGMNGIEI